ncbi:uncharacterized protein PV07_06822 [Cladophialophora immunda]|uniref:Secreted protein n=1 Tax=Cladophialophora immunda TaxID=569365 RepID=A0A0D1ZGN2_9EURO|nr:uncharacterized protein PV07_06822 [Cladophialophora immunda]KIW27041.1 hypothetical protein PV07_06822 [Cladophialophora immunda]
MGPPLTSTPMSLLILLLLGEHHGALQRHPQSGPLPGVWFLPLTNQRWWIRQTSVWLLENAWSSLRQTAQLRSFNPVCKRIRTLPHNQKPTDRRWCCPRNTVMRVSSPCPPCTGAFHE